MTDTIDAVVADEVVDQKRLAEQLVAQARDQGMSLVGPGGLLNQVTKRVLETALEAEMSSSPGLRQARVRGPRRGRPARAGCGPRPY